MGAIIPNFEARPFSVAERTVLAANATNAGVFCGGRFWDIVSIESSTQMTIKLRDVFGAVITMIG